MKILALVLLSLFSTMVMAQVSEKSDFKDKFSYSYGYILAKTQQNILPDVNVKTALQGFHDFAQGKEPPLSEEQMREVLQQALVQEKAKPLHAFEQEAAKNQQLGEQFLKQNAKLRDVIKLKSGLQVQGLPIKNEKNSKHYQQVEILYEGRLLDGTVFDSSIARDEKRSFVLNQLIQGLQQGINLMSVGDKARFFIPAHLAYGEIGSGIIPPSSVLIFDVELISAQ